jgi:hypothetical protein
MRGSRIRVRSVWSRQGKIERDAGEMDGEEGGRAGIYGRREKRRGSARCAFPDRAAAKPGGADRRTEIISDIEGFNIRTCSTITDLQHPDFNEISGLLITNSGDGKIIYNSRCSGTDHKSITYLYEGEVLFVNGFIHGWVGTDRARCVS